MRGGRGGGFDNVMWGRFDFDYGGGGGGGGGSSLDYVRGGKNCQNIDYVICERPLT